ncbi:MAG TPA: FG-GAP-like repeat-containing protein, partial [Nannocystaceae bacterium]|nr:FG-GAP-like repeat-containing protein [Nannocystaceae bacterium]
SAADSAHDDADGSSAGVDDGALFDVPSGTAEGGNPPLPSCEVQGDMNGIGDCEQEAPPDSFEPDVQWTWTPELENYSIVTPLVANLTDDNGDGAIDLCDVPDIVVVCVQEISGENPPGHIYVLDGATGTLHTKFETPVYSDGTPAIADFGNDGRPEIVTGTMDGHVVMFDPDGNVLSTSQGFQPKYFGSAIALADVDADGDIEIAYDDMLLDESGTILFDAQHINIVSEATALADLDGDGDQEVIFGNRAVHHDGSPYYDHPELTPGFPAIADLDDDPQPEVLLTNEQGITILEHDGATKLVDLRPTGDEANGLNWSRPATVHDFDGDGIAEFALSSSYHYSVYTHDAAIVWSSEILDDSGIAAGTAFDFLGDGEAEAMYADEYQMRIYGEVGQVLLETPRMSRTMIEYPVVADVDNDGSAEIVVVSNETTDDVSGSPTVQVIRDKEDRWIQARRIWNQHTYHVTNVREDATIPQHEVPHWTLLNTYRTNAQIEGGSVCQPVPEG